MFNISTSINRSTNSRHSRHFRHFFLIILLLFTNHVLGQYPVKQQPLVKSSKKGYYQYPWAGGLNSAQFNEMDLDLDGVIDLLIFDRQGNRILPFINKGIANTIEYEYAPEFISLFPDLTGWVITEDYNNDNKIDIFTYNASNPGIIVYKNISENILKFELVVYPYLTSFYGSGYANILVTYADYPAITDLDDDGDLDILTFWALGSFVELNLNQSMEKYGIPDSLDFIRTESCWGHFAESSESSQIFLDSCYGQKPVVTRGDFTRNNDRHTGSTFLVLDLNGDMAKDLVLGDADYPGLIELINGGTSIDAFMISQNPDFPSNTLKTHIFSMPLAKYLDVNNDAIKDLVVSPFDPNPYVSENYKSIWLYQNTNTNDNPSFNYAGNRFLQKQMIDIGSGAYPVFFDYDNDGLTDLFIGNYGYYDSSYYDNILILHSIFTGKLAYFKNTGTNTIPEFEFIDNDFASISLQEITGVYPTFGDIDNDGDPDLLAGKDDGKILFYRNNSTPTNPDVFSLESTSFQNIDIGEYSTPQLFDIDNDQLLDLVIGEKGGNLNYYKNTGTPENPIFTLITDSLGKVNVTDYNVSYEGYSTPSFFNNSSGNLELLVGSEQGKIFYFTRIRENLTSTFPESDSLFINSNVPDQTMPKGFRTASAIADINQNTYLDLIIGNFSGGLQFFSDITKPPVNYGINDLNSTNILIYPNPATDKIIIDIPEDLHPGKLEITLFSMQGRKVMSQKFSQRSLMSLDVIELMRGLYLLEVRDEKGRVLLSEKVVVG